MSRCEEVEGVARAVARRTSSAGRRDAAVNQINKLSYENA